MLNLFRRLDGEVVCGPCHGTRNLLAVIHPPRPWQSLSQKGNLNPTWKGGKYLHKAGYVYVWLDDNDPMRIMTNSSYVFEHRLVMARFLGRPLLPSEEVHHKNGVKADNRIENLELWKASHPKGQRVDDFHCVGCRCFER